MFAASASASPSIDSSATTTTTITSQSFSFFDDIETKKVRVGDIDIAYKIFGEGKPLILIPGFSMTMDMWDPNMLNRLSSNHTIIIFDNSGVGGQLLATTPKNFQYNSLFYVRVGFFLLLSNTAIIAPTIRVIIPTMNKITPAIIPIRGCRFT